MAGAMDGGRPPRLPGHFADCRPPVVQSEIIGAYDEDGDGELSTEERATMAEDVGAPPGFPGTPPPPDGERPEGPPRGPPGLLQALQFIYDADDSHALEDPELLALEEDLSAR